MFILVWPQDITSDFCICWSVFVFICCSIYYLTTQWHVGPDLAGYSKTAGSFTQLLVSKTDPHHFPNLWMFPRLYLQNYIPQCIHYIYYFHFQFSVLNVHICPPGQWGGPISFFEFKLLPPYLLFSFISRGHQHYPSYLPSFWWGRHFSLLVHSISRSYYLSCLWILALFSCLFLLNPLLNFYGTLQFHWIFFPSYIYCFVIRSRGGKWWQPRVLWARFYCMFNASS